MGKGGDVISAVGGGDVVAAVGGGFVKEEDGKSWLVTLGSRGGMVPTRGGDFAKEEDGEGCLGIMVFNFRRMASSLESMEAWAAASLALAAPRQSTQAAKSLAYIIEERQVEPIVISRGRRERLNYLVSRTKTSLQATNMNSSLQYSFLNFPFIHCLHITFFSN